MVPTVHEVADTLTALLVLANTTLLVLAHRRRRRRDKSVETTDADEETRR
jgi:hypothetical protein